MNAKLVALRDITEDCQRERVRLGIDPSDPMGPRNCLYFEDAICEFAGVETKPDFRQFNGGWNRGMRQDKPAPIFVTYYVRSKSGRRTKTRAYKCESEEQVQECLATLKAASDIVNIRVNRCGRIKLNPKNIKSWTTKAEKSTLTGAKRN